MKRQARLTDGHLHPDHQRCKGARGAQSPPSSSCDSRARGTASVVPAIANKQPAVPDQSDTSVGAAGVPVQRPSCYSTSRVNRTVSATRRATSSHNKTREEGATYMFAALGYFSFISSAARRRPTRGRAGLAHRSPRVHGAQTVRKDGRSSLIIPPVQVTL